MLKNRCKSTSMLRRSTLLLTMILGYGCGSNPQLETLHGLQEENRILREKVSELETSKESAGREATTRVEELRKQHEDQLTSKEELHRERVAQLEKEVSDLQLKYGAVQREKLTLDEIVDKGPRLEEAKNVRAGIESLVLFVMLGLVLLLLGYVLFRYRTTRDRLNMLTIQTVSELRHLESRV